MADDLTAFLNARLDDDEAAAMAATGEVWEYRDSWVWSGPFEVADIFGYASGAEDVGNHIARHDPARVLREVTAKRRIVFMASRLPALTRDFDLFDNNNRDGWADALRHLAAVYSGHPDYRAEWAPSGEAVNPA